MTHLSFNLDDLVKELNSLLGLVAESGTNNKQITDNSKILGFDVLTNISINVGLAEFLNLPQHNDLSDKELLDVFENDDHIKLVALIPGIKKEDIETNVSDGFIEVKIKKGDSVFYRNIPCNVKPNQIKISSFTCNNSVLEIVFKKGGTDADSR
jgi:HSP20 family molecular chaperone IbpA